MFELSRLSEYREGNRLEAKLALGGLPHSIWETYSAFANTSGGIILLGVEERADGSLRAVGLPAPEKLVDEFLELLSDRDRVSANILSEGDVRIQSTGGKRVIVIRVPAAGKRRPVYIGRDKYVGTYRRDGDGDWRCSKEEVDGMTAQSEKERGVEEGEA